MAKSKHPPRSDKRPAGWMRATGLITAFALGLAAAFLITSQTNGPDETEQRIAELKSEESARDLVELDALTTLAKGSRDRLTPVLLSMAKAAPLNGSPAAPTAAAVAEWRTVVSAEEERYATTPSAGNGINVARTTMRSSVQQLAAAVDAFTHAISVPEPLRNELLTLAGEQRTLSLRTWSAAALQLDVVNVDAGKGHVHVYLPAGPDSGTLTPDGTPEGTP